MTEVGQYQIYQMEQDSKPHSDTLRRENHTDEMSVGDFLEEEIFNIPLSELYHPDSTCNIPIKPRG